MSDPDDIPGLAHFCEHMLFLGTEKVTFVDCINLFFPDILVTAQHLFWLVLKYKCVVFALD